MTATCPRCDHRVVNARPGQRVECWWCRHVYFAPDEEGADQ